MFKQKISIAINSEFDRKVIFDKFQLLLNNLSKTGLVQENYEFPFVQNNVLVSYHTTIEKTSLSKKYQDKYARKYWKDIEQLCNAQLKTEVIGKTLSDNDRVCICKRHTLFILFTHVFNNSSPIICGTCEKAVPIYKLQGLSNSDKYDIRSWEKNYRACDDLQLGCTVGEQWATKQMSDPGSQLSKQGLAICSKIQDITGVPVYYYLFNYRNISLERDKARTCPSCDGRWLQDIDPEYLWNFKCDNCRLVSSFTSNVK